ncbi:DUF3426 domain-containing protein, partial [Psychrobacter sp. I-STPA6b]|uniref:DUF3426 domain-containing protein n=1 Tax=Psychrobacter sp. I-STPA6b TaxID=2585718 RepID=UPI001D0CBD51
EETPVNPDQDEAWLNELLADDESETTSTETVDAPVSMEDEISSVETASVENVEETSESSEEFTLELDEDDKTTQVEETPVNPDQDEAWLNELLADDESETTSTETVDAPVSMEDEISSVETASVENVEETSESSEEFTLELDEDDKTTQVEEIPTNPDQDEAWLNELLADDESEKTSTETVDAPVSMEDEVSSGETAPVENVEEPFSLEETDSTESVYAPAPTKDEVSNEETALVENIEEPFSLEIEEDSTVETPVQIEKDTSLIDEPSSLNIEDLEEAEAWLQDTPTETPETLAEPLLNESSSLNIEDLEEAETWLQDTDTTDIPNQLEESSLDIEDIEDAEAWLQGKTTDSPTELTSTSEDEAIENNELIHDDMSTSDIDSELPTFDIDFKADGVDDFVVPTAIPLTQSSRTDITEAETEDNAEEWLHDLLKEEKESHSNTNQVGLSAPVTTQSEKQDNNSQPETISEPSTPAPVSSNVDNSSEMIQQPADNTNTNSLQKISGIASLSLFKKAKDITNTTHGNSVSISTGRNFYANLFWTLGCGSLVLLLLAQYVIFNLDTLIKDPVRQAQLSQFCHAVSCALPAADPQSLDIINQTQRSSKILPGGTDILATLANTSNDDQLYPNLHVKLYDNGTLIGEFIAAPEDYLTVPQRLLSRQQVKLFMFTVDIPNKDITEIDMTPIY